MDNAHALVVGIAAYQQVNRLPDTVAKDARDVHDLLIDERFGAYPAQNVELIVDGEATGAGLRRALASLAQRCTVDSVALVYISGHGARLDSGPYAGEYLLPVDAVAASGESLSRTAISGGEFAAALAAVAARAVVVVFDCCHARGIGQAKDAARPALRAGLPESYYERLKAGRGRAILASCRSSEYSYVLPGESNSLFTKHLLAGLRGGIASEDGLIRIFDLFEYVQPRVTVAHPGQHPVFVAEIEENLVVARSGQRGGTPADEQGFRYDVYVSFAEESEPDARWVWETLWPRLQAAGLRVAISDDVAEPGVARVVSMERGIRQSRRTLVVLSPGYLASRLAQFENILAQTMSIEEGAARLIPVVVEPVDANLLPYRLSPHVVGTVDLAARRWRPEDPLGRLARTLQEPVAALF